MLRWRIPSSTRYPQTTVSLSVDACKEFTVTIPSSADITSAAHQSAVSLDARNYDIDDGKTVNFKVALTDSTNYSDGQFYLAKNADNKLMYKVFFDVDQITALNTDIINVSWTQETAQNEHVASAYLGFTMGDEPEDDTAPGVYSDTLTFTVFVTEK